MELSRLSLQEKLWSHQNVDYQMFNRNLLPKDIQPTVIGVRLPILRELAEEIAAELGEDKEQLETWFKNFTALRSLDPNLKTPDNKAKFFFEEKLIGALVVAYSPVPIADKAKLIKAVVEKMDNWSLCDSFTNTIVLETPEDNKALKNLIKTWMKHLDQAKINNPYVLRFVLVSILHHFFPMRDYDYGMEIIKKIQYPADTVRMAKAWVLSQYVAQKPEVGMEYLRNVPSSELDLETYILTVRKINESQRVDKAVKDLAKSYLKSRREGVAPLE